MILDPAAKRHREHGAKCVVLRTELSTFYDAMVVHIESVIPVRMVRSMQAACAIAMSALATTDVLRMRVIIGEAARCRLSSCPYDSSWLPSSASFAERCGAVLTISRHRLSTEKLRPGDSGSTSFHCSRLLRLICREPGRLSTAADGVLRGEGPEMLCTLVRWRRRRTPAMLQTAKRSNRCTLAHSRLGGQSSAMHAA